jgi:hypothetical protein
MSVDHSIGSCSFRGAQRKGPQGGSGMVHFDRSGGHVMLGTWAEDGGADSTVVVRGEEGEGPAPREKDEDGTMPEDEDEE